MRRERGFTLIEIIVAMVVMAITAVAVVAMQGRMFQGSDSVKDMQVGSRLMLECAEHVLATRRHAAEGYSLVVDGANFGAAKCGDLVALGGYAVPSVGIVTITGSECPSGYECKRVTITHSGLANITLMLVDY
jgi:prepilin-type N-terminal cleavage/methylation domain-containing protein